LITWRSFRFPALKWRYLWYLPLIALFLAFWFSLPGTLFRDPTSTVLLDRTRHLLGAKISADQQWRFPECSVVPEKFRQAILHYEDRHFAFHPGFNPVALSRALYLNMKNRRIVTGGSTITMQVIRLSRKGRDRTYLEKCKEILLAFRMELTYSKREILRLYASYAPFGGNVVGLDAAAWRYFGVDAAHLSWAESATLAVLPNSPGLIYPGRNHHSLQIKRDRLLESLYQDHIIDRATCDLARSEKLPEKPWPLPQLAPHLITLATKHGEKGKTVLSTIDIATQQQVNTILGLHSPTLLANQIHNAAVLIIEVETGNVVAYAGNLPATDFQEHGNQVDIIQAPRSTGSILKPFLFAGMLNDGLLLPSTLVPDIPTRIGGFIPENYNLSYDGAVPAKRALSRSLNIPAVRMLQTYGYEQFYTLLRNIGMTTLIKPAGHYGLTLVLGGAEATLWDLAGIYASMARTLNHYNAHPGKYTKADYHPPQFHLTEKRESPVYEETSSWFDAASIWLTFEAMVEVSRPDEEQQWQQFLSSSKIAWKTGTSFGNRDAWSVGVTPEYVVAVWVGNATGEGRPGLTGIGVAAPILFDIFKTLPPSAGFRQPYEAMVRIPVCRNSGFRASPICDATDTIWVQKSGTKTGACPYHRLIHLDRTGKWQVNSGCESPDNMQHVSWFVLPPVQEWYFRNKNPFYKILPPFRPGCDPSAEIKNMEMIYPKNNSIVYIPTELDGKPGKSVFRLAHRNPGALVYWHVDAKFIGTTTQNHQMAIGADIGKHLLTLVDQSGETLTIRFEIMAKEKEK
jgi:penicillin-binding protein 1C